MLVGRKMYVYHKDNRYAVTNSNWGQILITAKIVKLSAYKFLNEFFTSLINASADKVGLKSKQLILHVQGC